MKRCSWVNLQNPTYVAYHDTEWGVPVTDDTALFECLVLEIAQAGLSWETVLKKRAGYKNAFKNYHLSEIVNMNERNINQLMADVSIVRHRKKIESTITNACAFSALQESHGSFHSFLHSWMKHVLPITHKANQTHVHTISHTYAYSLHKTLTSYGFSRVGVTTAESYIHAIGLVNGHEPTCFRYVHCVNFVHTPPVQKTQ